jgi:hypothetical protein
MTEQDIKELRDLMNVCTIKHINNSPIKKLMAENMQMLIELTEKDMYIATLENIIKGEK